MTRATIEINQVSKYGNYYWTSKRELRFLVNFLAKFLKGYDFDCVQDAKGGLEIKAIHRGVNQISFENRFITFQLRDEDVENVLDVIKSGEYLPDLIYKKFTLKFKKF